jgi:hypothetical protein
VRTWAAFWIAGIVLASGAVGCATRAATECQLRRRPPVPSEAVDAQLAAFRRAGLLAAEGDPLVRYLHDVQDFADYVMGLRGEGYVEEDGIAP